MPPRKSDAAASRKSDVGIAATAAAATEPGSRPVTPTNKDAPAPAGDQPPVMVDGVGALPIATSPSSTKAPGGSGTSAGGSQPAESKERRESKGGDALTIEDLNLPRSIITRLAKGVLPPNTQIQGSAITAMSKSAIVFINHLANAANTITTDAGKKTVMPADVFAALDDIEFGFMKPQLEAEFAKFTHIQTSKRSDYRKRAAAAKKATTEGGSAEDGDGAKPAEDGEGAGVSAVAAGDADKAESPDKFGGKSSTAKATSSSSKSRDVPPQAKKVKRKHDGAGSKGSNANGTADVDETISDNATDAEEGEDAVVEDDDVEDEDEEDEEEEDEEDEDEEEEEDDVDDGLEDRPDVPDDDEALDSDGSE